MPQRCAHARLSSFTIALADHPQPSGHFNNQAARKGVAEGKYMQSRFLTVRFALVSLVGVTLLLPSLLAAKAAQAQTVTVASNTPSAGSETHYVTYYLGTSFTTMSGGTFNNLVFNLYSDANSTVAYAVGTGYLLSQDYLGSPGSLSSSTAGYVTSVAASSNHYTFSSSATLQGNTTYWFYENVTQGSGYVSSVAGETAYVARSNNFGAINNSQMSFNLTGTESAGSAPEPGALCLLALSGLPIVGIVARRRSAA